jgi:hypothetical protein
MQSSARRSPTARKLRGITDRIAALERYERWREPLRFDFGGVVGAELWDEHWRNWSAIMELMKTSQIHAALLRSRIAAHARDAPPASRVSKIDGRNR